MTLCAQYSSQNRIDANKRHARQHRLMHQDIAWELLEAIYRANAEGKLLARHDLMKQLAQVTDAAWMLAKLRTEEMSV